MRALRTLVLAAVAALALLVPASALARPLIIGGSTSVLPLAQKLASAYHSATHQPQPKVTGGQSDIGISGVHEGRFDIGDSSRDPIKGTDPTGLVFTKIARDGVCIVTNKSNAISTLSQSDRRKHLHRPDPRLEPGARREDLGPDRPVRPRRRLRYPGRLPAHLPGRKHRRSPRARRRRPPTASRKTRCPRDKQAIGFVSFAYTKGVNAVGYNGVACNLRNARSGQYLGVRNFWMVTKGAPEGRDAEVPRLGHQRQTRRGQHHQLAVDRGPLTR